MRNCFHEGVGIRTLKCIVGYNHYRRRNKIVNNGLVENKCSRCKREEDWEHVILCQGIAEIKDQCATELNEKLRKLARNE